MLSYLLAKRIHIEAEQVARCGVAESFPPSKYLNESTAGQASVLRL
jgi:hypothetical protein